MYSKSVALLSVAFVMIDAAAANPKPRIAEEHSQRSYVIKSDNLPVLSYNLVPPSDSALPLRAGGYFHPLKTPAGETLTDFAPTDHKHHRGVFLAWVEMHGEKDADFWGWGEHAPIKGRTIENISIKGAASSGNRSGFKARNHWKADDSVLIDERLAAELNVRSEGNVLDLTYELTPGADSTLSRWAFSGFCLRVLKEGQVEYHSPKGVESLPNPSHLKPESDWPNQPWYACTLKMPDGKVFGGAVLNHAKNPPTLWHNHRDVRMINPCIVAPGAVQLKKGKSLVLRYKVVAFDGAVPTDFLNDLARNWK
jgi:hypothetical protein